MKKRLRVLGRHGNARLKSRRQVEIRFRVYHDEHELLHEWADKYGYRVGTIMRALVDEWLSGSECKREELMRLK